MKKAILLGVNIDHAATLRQARYRNYPISCGKMIEPDPLTIALAAEHAGADGITIHLREDRRHIQDYDAKRIRESLRTRLNLEMAPTPEMVKIAIELKPDSVCLVPERREEISTEGGLNIAEKIEELKEIVKQFSGHGIITSLFIDPDSKQIDAAAEIGAPCVELHTGAYANAYFEASSRNKEFRKLCHAAENAANYGITVNAGHGINYTNISEIVELPHIHELNIGHSILSRALLFGIDEAVREMKSRMRDGITILPRP